MEEIVLWPRPRPPALSSRRRISAVADLPPHHHLPAPDKKFNTVSLERLTMSQYPSQHPSQHPSVKTVQRGGVNQKELHTDC